MAIKKILMVMPSLPWPETGAEQSDRAWGIRLLKELGYEVRVLAKWPEFKPASLIAEAQNEFGVEIKTVPYIFSNAKIGQWKKIKKYLYQLSHPAFWDGAALEYSEPLIRKEFVGLLDGWQPDLVWFEYTYLWPLYDFAKDREIKIITRSLNFEPDHFWQEDGGSFLNRIIYWAKMGSEKRIIRNSNHIFAITPNEEKIYLGLRAKSVSVLPLRGLSPFIGKNLKEKGESRGPNQVFFLGSSYNVSHNRQALEFLLQQIIPLANKLFPGSFIFNIFGAKVPAELESNLPDNVAIQGYAQDLSQALLPMDIALIPSLLGAGMQQKIFEPLVRGIPTISSRRGLAGYPFLEGRDLLLADTPEEFVSCLGRLGQDPELRARLAQNAVSLGRELFAKEVIKGMIEKSIK